MVTIMEFNGYHCGMDGPGTQAKMKQNSSGCPNIMLNKIRYMQKKTVMMLHG